MICPACQNTIPEESNFCSNCGCCVSSNIITVSSAVNTKVLKKKNMMLKVLIFIACGIIGLLLIFMLINKISDNIQIADYEEQIESYKKDISNRDIELNKYRSIKQKIVYIPTDESYIYHNYDCEHYDHNIPCYVTSIKTAEGNGCRPCPYCIKGTN